MFAQPIPALSNIMNAYVTMLTCQWLMGVCTVNDVELPSGEVGHELSECCSSQLGRAHPVLRCAPPLGLQVKKSWGMKVERCRYLEAAGCASVCMNSCKVPTQVGLALVLSCCSASIPT